VVSVAWSKPLPRTKKKKKPRAINSAAISKRNTAIPIVLRDGIRVRRRYARDHSYGFRRGMESYERGKRLH
jgi:hypothetical protein